MITLTHRNDANFDKSKYSNIITRISFNTAYIARMVEYYDTSTNKFSFTRIYDHKLDYYDVLETFDEINKLIENENNKGNINC